MFLEIIKNKKIIETWAIFQMKDYRGFWREDAQLE